MGEVFKLAGRACRPRAWKARLLVSASSHLKLELVPLVDRACRLHRRHLDKPAVSFTFEKMGDSTGHGPSERMRSQDETAPFELDVVEGAQQRHLVRQEFFGEEPHSHSTTTRTNPGHSRYTFHSSGDDTTYEIQHSTRPHQPGSIDWNDLPAEFRGSFKTPEQIAYAEIHKSKSNTAEPTLAPEELSPELRAVYENSETAGSPSEQADTPHDCDSPAGPTASPLTPSKRSLRKQQRIADKKELRKSSRERAQFEASQTPATVPEPEAATASQPLSGMSTTTTDATSQKSPPAQHKPLVVGRTKPKSTSISSMDSSAVENATSVMAKADLNKEIENNVSTNTGEAAPADAAANPPTKKKEKAPKQPKPPKAAPAAAPLSPALLDLRVGHILRAINHPNADSLYVSTIAMGDPEGAEHTQVDEETGKVVRTVCSGLNGLVPLAQMQDRRIIVVANLKPVNMRSIKSAAMVLAASPPAEEGADPHAADRVVELVSPPDGSEAGDKVYFEGWPYGEGKGPEKQLNPKKKQWEGIQPGFFTSEELTVGFDAGKSEVEGDEKGMLVVEGKGKCTVKSLKGAVVR